MGHGRITSVLITSTTEARMTEAIEDFIYLNNHHLTLLASQNQNNSGSSVLI